MNMDELYVLIWLILKVCLLVLVIFNFAIVVKLNTIMKIFIKNSKKQLEKQNELSVEIKYMLQHEKHGKHGKQYRSQEKKDDDIAFPSVVANIYPKTQELIQDTVHMVINNVDVDVDTVTGELVRDRDPSYNSF